MHHHSRKVRCNMYHSPWDGLYMRNDLHIDYHHYRQFGWCLHHIFLAQCCYRWSISMSARYSLLHMGYFPAFIFAPFYLFHSVLILPPRISFIPNPAWCAIYGCKRCIANTCGLVRRIPWIPMIKAVCAK